MPDLVGRTVNEATATAQRPRAALTCDDSQRPDDKVAGRPVMQQEPAAGVTSAPPAQVRVWVSTGPRADDRAAAGRPERSAAAQIRLEQDGVEVGIRLGVPIRRLSGRRRRRAGPGRHDRRHRRSRCCQSRRGGGHLRHARRDRHRRRARRRRAAARGLPRADRRVRSRIRACRRARSCGSSRPAASRSAASDAISLEVSR